MAPILGIDTAWTFHTDVLKKKANQHLNGLFMSDELREMLDEHDYGSLYMDFLFLSVFSDRGIGMSGRPMLKPLYTLYLDLLL